MSRFWTSKSVGSRLVVVVLLVCLCAAAAGLAIAQAYTPAYAQDAQPPGRSPDMPDAGSVYIPVQGYVTDQSGRPLNGSHDVKMRMYDVGTGGTALCEDVRSMTFNDGLFASYMYGANCPIDGRTLFLSFEVDDDGEMAPRLFVDNVPYAWSLRPGAVIRAPLTTEPVVSIHNDGSGIALSTGSIGGVALRAEGSGVIQSTAETYIWISGNGVRPYRQSDSTIIDMDNKGGAVIYRGDVATNKNVMLPITIPGTLYGQPARVTGLDLYWVAETDLDGISAILLRRQTGVCASCYASLLADHTDRTCEDSVNLQGCVTHFDLTNNNLLSSDSGILYLTIEMAFSGASTWVEIGGARLTLEYDE